MSQKILFVNSTIRDTPVLENSCLQNVSFVLYDYNTDTYDTLLQKIVNLGITAFDEVGFIFETSAYAQSFKLLSSQSVDSALCGVELAEPALDSWSEMRDFMNALKSSYSVQIIDFFACDFYSNPDWKYVLNTLEEQVGLHIRASTDATGNMANGGNWIMESDNTDIQSIFFNENIVDYQFVFASTVSANTTITQAMVDVAANWPMTINGGTVSSPVTVTFASNLTINSNTKYFIVGSQYVTIDGSGYSVWINGVTNYQGLVRNGTGLLDTPSTAGYSNVTVKNITIAAASTNSTMINAAPNYGSGWLCQEFFGNGLNSGTTCTNNNIINCINNADIIRDNTSGFVGPHCGSFYGNVVISNCINNGNLLLSGTNRLGGFTAWGAASCMGNLLIINSVNNGNILCNYGGGFTGPGTSVNHQLGSGSCIIQNSYNTGSVASGSGAFFGQALGVLATANSTPGQAINCYNIGTVATGGGGIYGRDLGNAGQASAKYIATNCYITKAAAYVVTGSIGTLTYPNTVLTAGTWSDTTADNTILTGTNGTVWVDVDSSSTNVPYMLIFEKPRAPTNFSFAQINNVYQLIFNNALTPSAITNYKYSLDNGTSWTAFSPAVTSSPIIIPGITSMLPYYIKLLAVNVNGDGAESSLIYGPGNKLLNSYIKGSFDVSGSNLNVLSGNVYINKDATVVGNLYANKNVMIGAYNSSSTVYPLYNTGTTQISSKLNVVGDASFNSRLFVGGDVSMNGFVSASSYAVNSIPLNVISGWVAATSNITTDASFNNRIFVGGDASLNGKLFVAEDATINNRLVIGGDTTVSNRLFVGSDATLNNRMFIGGDVSMNAKLFVSNDVSTNSVFNVLGDVSFNGKLFTANDITMNNRLFVGGDAIVNGQMFAAGDATLNGQLFVSGDASMNSRVFLGGDVSMNNRLFVGGDVSMNNRLFVGGDVSMNNRLFIGVDVSMNTKLFVGGDISINSKLFVLGDVSMNQNLFVAGDVSLNGRMNINTDVSLVNLNILKTAANQPRNIALNNAVLIGASSTYTATPITLTNANPVPQNIFISVAAPVLTLPTMNTNFAGMQLYIRKIGAAINQDLSINAPASASILVAAGTSSANATTLSIPKITSYTSVICDGVRWFQM